MCVPDRPSLPANKSISSPCNALAICDSVCNPAMSSNHWGTLINSDKSPAPLLEQLCLGIAQKIPSLDNGVTADLTPERLAAFYRQVGGNYDPLFLETKSQALSFIYQSLGCFHSLQPADSPYKPPCVPSLLPNGFVRWQTIQILMDPDENWQYLQNALKLWEIADVQGNYFPKELPRGALPSEPDPEMLQWHEGVSKRLKYDYEKRCDWEKKKSQQYSPPNFGDWRYRFNGKEALPDEDEYFSPPHRHSRSRQHSYADPDRESGSHRGHRRRLSSDYPAFTPRRREPSFVPRPDGGRSGLTSPRATSPEPRRDRPMHSRGRERASWYGRPFSPEAESDAQEADEDDTSDDTIHEEELARPRHRHRPRHLSPPSDPRARRHSHDAYTRKPARQFSPDPAYRMSHRTKDFLPPKTRKSTSESTRLYPEERSRSRPRSSIPASGKFRDYTLGGPVSGPPPFSRMAPRDRYPPDPYDDVRWGSHSSGSSSERSRSYGNAGFAPRKSRMVPSHLADDAGYGPSRRVPIYD
ncbi:hypothetical protein N7468_006240 [Penicillium chermesinum]|uniref:DUF7514 domain-containing protein n=1 Tax=Penicillium chermesinum TaxID=63820 RepID=A0A9W9NRX3_9EURO|nr:uncharacterized protein N7468_006240 [Penicillium chermesinum]KAJ5225015.1 hypothetical protein N7468_006240 [Penicillium chermesinum]KAJ6151745.1 hypothetical protein N7470_006873 [Penicillium chermesinum]